MEKHGDSGVWRYAKAAGRFLRNGSYRSYILLRLRKPRNLFQISSHTRENRHPFLFVLAREALGGGAGRRVLSFGCSTGEEVFTLRRYLPGAEIKGLDINAYNIRECRRKLRVSPDAKITFARADSTLAEPSGVYDAVFCLSVFRNGDLCDPSYARCDKLIQFVDFSAQVADISRCLKPGGLLFILGANFRFRDTPTAGDFELVLSKQLKTRNPAPIFDAGNRRTGEVDPPELVYRKKRQPPAPGNHGMAPPGVDPPPAA